MSHSPNLRPLPPPKEPPPEMPAQPSASPPHPHAPAGSRLGLPALGLIILAVLVVAVAFAIHSRITAESGLKKATQEAAILSVNIVHPSPIAAIEVISLPGSAQAFMDTPIFARTSGYLKSWSADIGTHVKKGQVLAEIETPEIDQQLEQSRADLKNAEANLNLSQLTAARSEDLFKRSTISSQERDQAVSDLASKRALVDSGRANVRRLEQLKAFEQVTAPFDGVITARNTDVGALIQAGDNTGARELFHLQDNHILRVYLSVPEVYAATIKADEKVSIVFDSYPGENFPGILVRDSAALDPKTHTLNVEADVDNASGRLFPGGYATVHLNLPPTAGAVTIPANTLLFRAEGTRVALVRNGRVLLTSVNIGHDHGNTLEVLGGLTPQDSVILDPTDSLAEGDAVRVESPKPEPPHPGA